MEQNFAFKPIGSACIYTSHSPTKRVHGPFPFANKENRDPVANLDTKHQIQPKKPAETREKCINVVVGNVLWSNPSKMTHFVCGKCGGSKLESLSVVQEREYTASVLRQRDKLQSAVSGEIGEAGEAGEIGKQKVKGEGRSQRARRRKRDKKKPAQTNDSPAPESIQPAAAEPVKLSVQPAAWTSTAEGTRQKKEIFCQKCNAAQPAVYNYRLQIAVTPLGTPRMHITLPTPKIDLPASLSVYHQSYEPPNAPKTTFGSPEEALRAAAQPELYLDNQHQQVWPLMAYNQVVERDMTAFPASKYEELCVRANTLGIDLHAAFSRAVQQAGPWMIQLSPVNDWLVNTSLQVRV